MMTHETHLPTQQAPPQKSSRVPFSHEDSRRTQGTQAPPKSRTQGSFSLNFPKQLKLRKRVDFLRMKQGRRIVGTTICIDWRKTSHQETRLGITASTRY